MLEHFMTHLPPLAEVSPITSVGIAVTGVALMLYLIRPLPEFLCVILTAVLYAAVPLIHLL